MKDFINLGQKIFYEIRDKTLLADPNVICNEIKNSKCEILINEAA